MPPKNELAKLQAQLAALQAENEALKAKGTVPVTLKVSELGAVSIYGLGRYPVTLYQEQMKKLLGMTDAIQEFIKANADKLSTGKDDPRFAAIKAARAAKKAEEAKTA